jgi:hypothetical protein
MKYAFLAPPSEYQRASPFSQEFDFGAEWTVEGGFRCFEKLSLRILGFDPAQW